MANVVINKELQKVSPNINEENIINDTIYELISEDEIDKLFRLYDKLKTKIKPGTIIRNGSNGISILNEAEYKTHAYLVANSKNFLTGESMMYSIDEVSTLLLQLDTLKSRLVEINSQVTSAFEIVSSFSSVITGITSATSDLMNSQDNVEKYSDAFKKFFLSLNTFTIDSLNNIVQGLQVEKNQIFLDNYSLDNPKVKLQQTASIE